MASSFLALLTAIGVFVYQGKTSSSESSGSTLDRRVESTPEGARRFLTAVISSAHPAPEICAPTARGAALPTAEVHGFEQKGNTILALVRQPGPLPWLRIEATIERDLVGGVTTENIADVQVLAADRLEVRLVADAALSAIGAWLAEQGPEGEQACNPLPADVPAER